jgi:quercetin dioxygenase-like cupin family protein
MTRGRSSRPTDPFHPEIAMIWRRIIGRRPTRRALLHTGFATAATLLALPELLASAAGDEVRLQPYDKAEAENYPWGWIRWLINGQIDPGAEMTMGLVHFEPHQINVLHVHPNSAEYLHVISGSSEHLMGDRWVALKPGDTLRIPKGVPHQARTQGESFRALVVYDTPRRIMVPVTEGTLPRS